MRPRLFIAILFVVLFTPSSRAAEVFLRARVNTPQGGKFRLVVGGFRHAGEPWNFPERAFDVKGNAWSEWVNLSDWPWHGRVNREGGIAEWPSVKITVQRSAPADTFNGCAVDVQLADKPDEANVVHSFNEKSESASIGFLVPHPLRERAKEFETGSQMAARHLAWAKEASGNSPATLKQFQFLTSLWGPYDPGLAKQSVEALKLLGFNVIGGADASVLRPAGVKTYQASWIYGPDPEKAEKEWNDFAAHRLKKDVDWTLREGAAHWVMADEIQTLNLRGIEPARRDGWFRDYLRSKSLADGDLPKPIAQIEFPVDAMSAKTLPRDANLPTRRWMYHAAKFGQWWSAKRLRHSTDLVKASMPEMKTETLPSDHGFLNAWGPPHIGMSYPMLDLFEIGQQKCVDQLSSEDWIGLNHMYGPGATWTGAQTLEYFTAICRSAIGNQDIHLRTLITPSDDEFIRLKTYSAIGQGTKSFFFWTFGPTYIGTENYWSDLKSEYDGIAKLSRAVQKSEEVLMAAKPVRDPVAILYSVSHDFWHTDNPAAFVEKRLTWHALRHLNVQPDFIREEDLEAGKLRNYKVLYINDWCISRRASAAIDQWVKEGGVVYLSAGAATRDEFYEPFVPAFAQSVWGDAPLGRFKTEAGHSYNERGDLPRLKPITQVTGTVDQKRFELPAIGSVLPLRPDVAAPFAQFADKTPAGAVVKYGKGTVTGIGFLPGLAYGQGAGFAPSELKEKWPDRPRDLIGASLRTAGIVPVAQPDVPVVEASLLNGAKGAAVVLANYTYTPIEKLKIDVHLPTAPSRATSTEGVEVKLEKMPNGTTRLTLPLKWTDIILLQ